MLEPPRRPVHGLAFPPRQTHSQKDGRGGLGQAASAERDPLPLGSQRQTDIRLIWNAG